VTFPHEREKYAGMLIDTRCRNTRNIYPKKARMRKLCDYRVNTSTLDVYLFETRKATYTINDTYAPVCTTHHTLVYYCAKSKSVIPTHDRTHKQICCS